MRLFIVTILMQLSIHGFSQQINLKSKPPIDTSVLNKWPELYSGALSPDGKYISYVLVKHIPVNELTTVLQTPDAKWKRELKDVKNIQFTSDSRNAVYLNNDTLFFIKLGNTQVIRYPNVKSYKLVPYSKGEWLAFQLKTKEFILQDNKIKKENRFPAVENYFFTKDGSSVVLQCKTEDGKENQLKWIDIMHGKEKVFWTGTAMPLQLIFDDASRQVALILEERGKISIWKYNERDSIIKLIVKEGDTAIKKGLSIGSLKRFSKDGDRLFFNLEKRYLIQPLNSNAADVNVWSYKDIKLQSQQLGELQGKKESTKGFPAVVNIKTEKIIQLQNEYSEIVDESDNYSLIRQLDTDQITGVGSTEYGRTRLGSTYFLVSNRDGNRIKLPWKYSEVPEPVFSPEGKYIIFRMLSTLHYFTYEIATKAIRNITSDITTDLTLDQCYTNAPIEFRKLLDIPGWLNGDSGVLVYDQNDIWLVDPQTKKASECITNGYGKKNGLVLRLALKEYSDLRIFQLRQKLILASFNKRTKKDGHFSIRIGQKSDPLFINSELIQYSVGHPTGSSGGNMSAMYPVKAKNQEAYLVKRQTTTSYPNYFYTEDLRNFKQLTFLSPEKDYNWMTSELYTWVSSEQDTLQGVLYKPENFDSSKKYPVLFSVYRQFSNELNSYLTPEWTTDRINIPWFVSNGYLVFTPDIHYSVPNLKKSVLNCITSAAKHIATLPFVDSLKLGAQGHSFGGLEMGYIITGTDLFSAVCSAAGSFDLISDVGTILPPPSNISRQITWETDMIYGTLWDKKDLFILNSPIFEADKVKAPFLIVAGELDNVKPYDQNIEFYLGLRRLAKPSWLLSYPEERHVIRLEKNYKDYTIRMTQFFDHYLKGQPAPRWMTKGIIASRKGIENGYELDPSGNCGMKGEKLCKICSKWNEQLGIISNMQLDSNHVWLNGK